jgi:prepilin-type N-terminal cleavage/methylation domain-containing protein/prepilin-type processing-associated H-X9-DG protein
MVVPRPRLAAFTLVELLVVIAIIGVLIALLLPAVNSARESARLVQCKNNLHQMGVAVNAHVEAYGFFPSGGWGMLWLGDPDCRPGASQPGSWIYQLLPFLEMNAIHDLGVRQGDARSLDFTSSYKYLTAGPILKSSPIPMFNCPSRRRTIIFPDLIQQGAYNSALPNPAAGLSHSDYCANTGTWDPAMDATYDIPGDPNCANNYPNCQWDPDATNGDGVVFQASEVPPAKITDGLSNTFFAGEKWLGSKFYCTSANAGDDNSMMQGFDHDVVRWCSPKTPPIRDIISPDCATNGASYWCPPADYSFGSAHSAGVQFVFCDGHVVLVSYEINMTVYGNLGCRNDGNVDYNY